MKTLCDALGSLTLDKGLKNILNRNSTLRYEVSKLLGCDTTSPTEDDIILKKKLLNCNSLCEYCETKEASTKDHYMALVKNELPTQYCNDIWNIIPCCTTCNSSKGGKSFFEWRESGMQQRKKKTKSKNPFKHMDIEKANRIQAKFVEYDKAFQERHIQKVYPKELNETLASITPFLIELQKQVYVHKQNTQYIRACDARAQA